MPPGEMARHAMRAPAVLKTIGNHGRSGSTVWSIIARIGHNQAFMILPAPGTRVGKVVFVSEDPFALLDALKDIISQHLQFEP
jgi:hypothetical protein